MNGNRRLTLVAAVTLLMAACGPAASPTSSTAPLPSAVATEAAASPGPTEAAAVSCGDRPVPFDPALVDLTGAWAGDDEGIYYLRQVETTVWWNGMSEREGSPSRLGLDWNNVGRGEIDGLTINVEWADVPRGEILGGGTLTLTIEDDGTGNVRIVKTTETGSGFGNNVWTPCEPG